MSLEDLKKELQGLKAKQSQRSEVEKVKAEIKQLKRHEQALDYRTKHPIMTRIADKTISFGKRITTPPTQQHIRNVKKIVKKKVKKNKSDIQNLIDEELKY